MTNREKMIAALFNHYSTARAERYPSRANAYLHHKFGISFEEADKVRQWYIDHPDPMFW